MNKTKKTLYYSDYLKLNKLLNIQSPESKQLGKESHDETLFIITHQVYELWFKQIIHEIDSIINLFKDVPIKEDSLLTVNSRLQRIINIQNVLIMQFDIIETMTPMDFLEFRDLLVPASGFQSTQFKELEIKMGLGMSKRFEGSQQFFLGKLKKDDQEYLKKIDIKDSLFHHIEKWLERLPFTNDENFNFWEEYKSAVKK